MKKFLVLLLVLLSSSSFAKLKYVQVKGRIFVDITEEEFNKCRKKIFRNISKDQLSKENQIGLLQAQLKGYVINDILMIRRRRGACSYVDTSEL